MMRAAYSVAMWLAQPFLRRKLARRAAAEPGYSRAVGERFGHYGQATPPAPGLLWIHAVSLGETRTAALLIDALRARQPALRVLLTHGTATGRGEGEGLLRDGDQQAWLPWDTPGAVRRFLDHFRPVMGVLIETEVWPNIVAECHARGVPLVLANARLSASSLQQALRLAALSRPAYRALAAVWAQTEADAQRLRQLDAPVQAVLGNLKFDATPDAGLLARGRTWRASAGRPVVMLASAREGEEDELLRQISTRADARAVQWLLVPRHPQRFDEVALLVARQGMTASRRSAWADGPLPADVWLGDSLGEMALYYGLSDVALLGGSFAPLGGQNLIEAAACGCPVVMGPHTFNFAEAAELAAQAGAAVRVAGVAEAVAQALALAADADLLAASGLAAQRFALAHQGATQHTAEAVLALLPAFTSPAAR